MRRRTPYRRRRWTVMLLTLLGVLGAWCARPHPSVAQVGLFSDLFIFRTQAMIDQVRQGISRGISRIPFSSTPGGFVFRFDPVLGIPQPVTENLGPLFLERAPTLGRGVISAGVSWTKISFDLLDGKEVDDLFDATVVERPGGPLTITRVQDVNLDLDQSLVALSVFYGVTERFDMGIVVPYVFNRLRAVSSISGTRQVGEGAPRPLPTTITSGRLDEDGLGDLLLRAKYYFGDQPLPFDFSLALDLKFPTGDEDKLLGNGDFEVRPFAMASRSFGPVTAHLNLGALLNTDSSERNGFFYGVGADVRLHPRLTASVEHLGQADDENFLADLALGLKWNPWKRVVIRGSMRFNLNDEGLRDRFIPSFGIEANF